MQIQTTAVIGAGTMGHALALVHSLGGCKVTLHDSNPETLAQASGLIRTALDTLQQAEAVTLQQAQFANERIIMVDSLAEAVESADLVIEAVVEIPDIKTEVFTQIDQIAPANAIIASNTSYLDVFPLIPAARQRYSAIAHWYTPPYIIDLVDLVPGPETSEEVIQTLHNLYKGFGKAPLVLNTFLSGYIANRLQAALNLECLRLIDEGYASASDIDFSIRHGLVDRLVVLGHMRKMDYTGLKMVRNGIAQRTYDPPRNTGRSSTLDKLIKAGRFGVRAGAGFYDYGATPDVDLFKNRDLKLLRLKHALQSLEEDP